MRGIEFELHAFAGAEDSELVVGFSEQGFHVAIASVISSRVRVRSGFAALRIGINRVTRRMQANFFWIAEMREGRLGQRNFGNANVLRVRSLVDTYGIPIDDEVGDDADAARTG